MVFACSCCQSCFGSIRSQGFGLRHCGELAFSSERDVTIHATCFELEEVRFGSIPCICQHGSWAFSCIGKGFHYIRQKLGGIRCGLSQSVGNNDLCGVIDDDLSVVALLETVPRFHDAAVGVGEVLLCSIRRNSKWPLVASPRLAVPLPVVCCATLLLVGLYLTFLQPLLGFLDLLEPRLTMPQILG